MVQLGDLTDRGPDSLKAIRLLQSLARQAEKVGGQVNVLIGNHESMNVIGDLRYVHPGEYKAFKDSGSKARRDAYYERTKSAEKTAASGQEEAPVFDREHRKAFDARFPLGYVNHRLAWQPNGELGKWVLQNSAILVDDGNLYAHGGVSPNYSSKSVSEINTRVRTDLVDPDILLDQTSILQDDDGPLWYRGWINLPETAENHAKLDAVLSAFNAKRMIVAHTPALPTVLPRFDGKVLMVDVGIAEHYGSGTGVLELINGDPFVRHGDTLTAIPQDSDQVVDYLEKVSSLLDSPTRITSFIEKLKKSEQAAAKAVSN